LAVEDAGFTGPDVEVDESAIVAQVEQSLSDRVPGWIARPGNQETWIIEAFGAVAAEIRSLAADVPAAIFVTYGEEVLAIPIRAPVPATGLSTWVAVDELGYSIPVGTEFTLAAAGDDLRVFQVTGAATIEPGTTTLEGVEFAAVDEGKEGNG